MISILLPTRNRPQFLKRLVDSIRKTSTNQPEIVVYIDDDDMLSPPVAHELGLITVIGPKIIMTDMWNKCYEKATGDIVMQMGDDVIFRTPGWDLMVEEEFTRWPDRIVLVHGDDLEPNFGSRFGTHSCVHRKWVETLGYFIPPYFSSDNGDRWLMAVADFIGRRKFIPIVTEHMHFRTNKAELDDTYKERLARHLRDNPNELYSQMFCERLLDAEKLLKEISEYEKNKENVVYC